MEQINATRRFVTGCCGLSGRDQRLLIKTIQAAIIKEGVIIANELQPLSNDLTKITTEIKTYQSIGGQAIFEIGRRLSWVKEHDLAHGEFVEWLSSIKMDRHTANHFMKIASQLRNGWTSTHLGATALYLIATMPADERDKEQQLPNGETKKPEDMTVRELREVKRQLKQREQELSDKDEQIASQEAELEDNRKTQLELNKRLSEQPNPQVVEKTITKEVKPADYDEIKSRLSQLEAQSKQDKKDIEYYQNELKASENRRKQAESDDHLKELELKRKKRDAQIDAYSVSLKITDFLPELQKITQDDVDRMGDEAKHNLRTRIDMVRKTINNIDAMFNGPKVIEGEISNDEE